MALFMMMMLKHAIKQIRLSALARRGIGNASDKNALLEAGDFYRERAEKMFCGPQLARRATGGSVRATIQVPKVMTRG